MHITQQQRKHVEANEGLERSIDRYCTDWIGSVLQHTHTYTKGWIGTDHTTLIQVNIHVHVFVWILPMCSHIHSIYVLLFPKIVTLFKNNICAHGYGNYSWNYAGIIHASLIISLDSIELPTFQTKMWGTTCISPPPAPLVRMHIGISAYPLWIHCILIINSNPTSTISLSP